MSSAAELPLPFPRLLDILEDLDQRIPEGFKVEIVGESIVMSPWSKGAYLPIMRSLTRQLNQHAPENHVADVAPCLYVFPSVSRAFGPDIHVADADAVVVDSIRLPGEALSLAAELTSGSTRGNDWGDKLEAYGKAGVPVYLLVDMQKETVSVFSAPSDHGYQSSSTVEFGQKIHIPEPFDFTLDTSSFSVA
ncbi:Uma2 family endonuclease [Actinacidiphila oryziradicis]|uniref:Uma2 family endonuclease n=1 Tax=Actinacidiphila oryziradicis TaxID=2571141 RepID=A0A4U0SLU9_9ACTN|nr:Uma2 family endonuclease [Actinacidiphila oryziradicis]TKA10890.1 Uma2 family endonuclease [Actinacidiphila oryziradicis]